MFVSVLSLGVLYLYDTIAPDQLKVPQYIMDFDERENGKAYYLPASNDIDAETPQGNGL